MAAVPAVVRQMRQYLAPEARSLWRQRFPGQILDNLAVATELGRQGIELEGHELIPIALGHTDMDDTTCLHVPSARLVAAGDAVYNGVYPQLREPPGKGRKLCKLPMRTDTSWAVPLRRREGSGCRQSCMRHIPSICSGWPALGPA
jgi:hypothetical protein